MYSLSYLLTYLFIRSEMMQALFVSIYQVLSTESVVSERCQQKAEEESRDLSAHDGLAEDGAPLNRDD